jgi:hypothetical protein
VPPLQLRLAARSLVSLEATMPGAFHAVDSVPMQAAYLAADGTARTTYVVVWVGHGLEEASYEPRESFTGQQPAQRQLMATDILPLEARQEPVTVGMLGDADAIGFSVPVNNSNW